MCSGPNWWTEAREQGQEAPLEAARASSPTVRLGKVEWRHVIKEAELLTGEAGGLQTRDLEEESSGLLWPQERAGLAGSVPNLGREGPPSGERGDKARFTEGEDTELKVCSSRSF